MSTTNYTIFNIFLTIFTSKIYFNVDQKYYDESYHISKTKGDAVETFTTIHKKKHF